MNNLAPIVTLAVAIVAGLWGIGKVAINLMNDKLQAALLPLAGEITTMKKYHGEHFGATRDLETNLASLASAVHSHGTMDDQRFEAIKDMCSDIKAEVIRSRERIDVILATRGDSHGYS